MSGPKVVRVVTRDQLIATGQGQIARMEAALAEWERACRRHDVATDAEVSAAKARLNAVRTLLREGRFEDVQRQTAAETHFLQNDQRERMAKVALAIAEARRADRRRCEAAQSLLAELLRRGVQVPTDIATVLSQPKQAENLMVVMQRGFALLAKPAEQNSKADEALAERHRTGLKVTAFADWLASQPPGESDPIVSGLERHIAELKTLEPWRNTTAFEDKMKAAEEADMRRNVLLDALTLEVGAEVVEARKRAKCREELVLVDAELVQAGVVERVADSAYEGQTRASLEEFLRIKREALVQRQNSVAASARRQAVLQGLAKLGYEVGATMETAWIEQKRVVLRSVSRPDYGVEITGDLAERAQVRAVAFAGSGDGSRSRDLDAETIWCSEVGVLKASLASSGGQLVIEQAFEVGATPLKRVAPPIQADQGAEVIKKGPTSRTV